MIPMKRVYRTSHLKQSASSAENWYIGGLVAALVLGVAIWIVVVSYGGESSLSTAITAIFG